LQRKLEWKTPQVLRTSRNNSPFRAISAVPQHLQERYRNDQGFRLQYTQERCMRPLPRSKWEYTRCQTVPSSWPMEENCKVLGGGETQLATHDAEVHRHLLQHKLEKAVDEGKHVVLENDLPSSDRK
jgi:hypothetical protein